MLSQTRLREIDRRWRAFVFGSRFTHVLFAGGIVLFVVALFLRSHTDILMRRGFTAWFGFMLLYFVSSFLLTSVSSFRQRDFTTALWMAAWSALLSFAAFSSFALTTSK